MRPKFQGLSVEQFAARRVASPPDAGDQAGLLGDRTTNFPAESRFENPPGEGTGPTGVGLFGQIL